MSRVSLCLTLAAIAYLSTNVSAWSLKFPWSPKPLQCRYYFEKLRPDSPRPDTTSESERLAFAQLSDVIRDPSNIVRHDFDPDTVLSEHGIDPKSISIATTMSDDLVTVFNLELRQNQTLIGFASVLKKFGNLRTSSPVVHMADIKVIREDYRGRGLGTLMYLLAAHVSATQFQSSLLSTPLRLLTDSPNWLTRGHSPAAERTWVNLIRRGYAKEARTQSFYTEDGIAIFYVIDANEWNQTPANQAIAKFYSDHIDHSRR